MSEWISIKDKIPPEDTKILCITEDGEFYVTEYWFDEDDKHVFFNPPIANIDNVTHWMWLPKPPKETKGFK